MAKASKAQAGTEPADVAPSAEGTTDNSAHEPMGLAPSTTPAAPPAEEAAEKPDRQGVVIVCPYHNTRCRANRSEPYFTRYYCPEEGCTFSHKVPRPRIDALRQQDGEDFSAR